MPKTGAADPIMICDAHADTLSRGAKGRRDLFDFPDAQLDLRRLEESGVVLQFLAVFVDPSKNRDGGEKPYLEQIYYYQEQVAKYPSRLKPILTVSDLPKSGRGAHIHTLLAVEGGECLRGQLTKLDQMYDLGVRSLGLTWNYNNELGHGASDTSKKGMTEFGRQVIAAMNRKGMLIDAAHLSEACFWEVLERSEMPIIVSHACCRRLKDHPRNLTDRQMEALAKAGGVMGITLVNDFLGGTPGIRLVLDHFLHAIKVMGPRHVALGTDFDGVETPVAGLEDAGRLPQLIAGLRRKGISEEDLSMVMGGNILRLLTAVL